MKEHVEIHSHLLRSTYDSLDELADAVDAHATSMERERDGDWCGGSFAEALESARYGWEEHLTETLAIVEDMVTKVERDHDVETFQPSWELSGAEVDVARYLSGVPENMIDYPMVSVPRAGRVITLCATVGARSQITPEAMIARGQIATAFALIVSRLGYSCELWADSTAKGNTGRKRSVSVRTMVKGCNDTLDASRILFAYAHPGMLRHLTFSLRRRSPWIGDLGAGLGYTQSPDHDMPEGTIYLDYANTNDMASELRRMLREAGLLVSE